MKIGAHCGLLVAFIAKYLAAANDDTGGRMSMIFDRDLMLSFTKNADVNKCPICLSPLIDTADGSYLTEENSDYSHLCVCPHTSLHAFHTDCIARSFAYSLRCPMCNRNCLEFVRDALASLNAGNQVLRKRLLSYLAQQRSNAIMEFFDSLQLFPAEFIAIRHGVCDMGEELASVGHALDKIWNMQLGVPGLSQYFLENGIHTSPPYTFYNDLQVYINASEPKVSQAIDFIKTLFAKYKNENSMQRSCMEQIVCIIASFSRQCMRDDDIYDILMVMAEKNCPALILNFIYPGKFIRSISAEKIVRLIERSVASRTFNYAFFWMVWVMVGAGRSFSPEDLHAINKCIDGIRNAALDDIAADTIDELKAMVEANAPGNIQACKWLLNYKEEKSTSTIKISFIQNGILGLLGSATKEELVKLLNEMIEANCSIIILKEAYFMIPEARRSNEICMTMMRRIIREEPIADAIFFIRFIPRQGCFTVDDTIELCELARNVQNCSIDNYCTGLLIASFEKIKQCLEKSEEKRMVLYEYFQKIELYWGIALFGNYFKHFAGYDLIILQKRESIIGISSHRMAFCCRNLPRLHEESPLLHLLSRNISTFLWKSASSFTHCHPLFHKIEYRFNHVLAFILGSPFFRKSISARSITAFCNSQFINMKGRNIQNICIFFNIVRNKYQVQTMKRQIYTNLSIYIPLSELAVRLAGIGFSFTEAANDEWEYRVQDSRKRKRFSPGVIDDTIDAMIRKADKYQLLGLLREKILGREE